MGGIGFEGIALGLFGYSFEHGCPVDINCKGDDNDNERPYAGLYVQGFRVVAGQAFNRLHNHPACSDEQQ